MVDQRVGETIGLDGLARLRERQVLLGQNALGAEYHFHLVEPLGESQQELDAARKGDRLECREAGEEILPTRLLTAGQLGTKDRQRLSDPLQLHLGKKIIRDDPSSVVDSLIDESRTVRLVACSPSHRDETGLGDPRPLGRNIIGVPPDQWRSRSLQGTGAKARAAAYRWGRIAWASMVGIVTTANLAKYRVSARYRGDALFASQSRSRLRRRRGRAKSRETRTRRWREMGFEASVLG